jgi:hypothetical protein
LVKRDDFDDLAGRVTTLYVDWPARFCHPEHKTTGAMFILGIIFNHFATCYRFAQFLNCNAARNALVEGMFGKLKLICGDFRAKLGIHGCHILPLIVINVDINPTQRGDALGFCAPDELVPGSGAEGEEVCYCFTAG